MLKKRIPTLLGLLLLVIGVVGGVLFINQNTNFLPRAAPEYTPQRVKISNITDSGFVVSWITKEPSLGFVKYSDNPLSLSTSALDDRDQLSGSSGEYRTHYVTIQNLKSDSTYYFKIGSQGDQLYDNNGQPFSLTLPKRIDQKPDADTIFGTVLTPVDTPAEGAIVYISIPGAAPLSALVKQNGNWATNLSQARATDLTSYVVYDSATTQIDLLVQSSDGEPTTAVTKTDNDQPVPTIIIGESNIFTNQAPVSTPVPNLESENQPDPPAEAVSQSSKFNLNPLLVEQDGSLAIDSIPSTGIIDKPQPLFQGQAPPNTTLTITVHSPVAFTGSIVADENGSWSWMPPESLDQGEHTISISYTDLNGSVHTAEKTFTIQTLSLQPVDISYAATPSATPAITPSSTPKPTAVPAQTPTPKPTPRTTVASGSADIIAGNTIYSYLIILIGILSLGTGLRIISKRG